MSYLDKNRLKILFKTLAESFHLILILQLRCMVTSKHLTFKLEEEKFRTGNPDQTAASLVYKMNSIIE